MKLFGALVFLSLISGFARGEADSANECLCPDGLVYRQYLQACVYEPLPHICPRTYIPVCGCDGKTYANDCSAEVHGVTSWTQGECR